MSSNDAIGRLTQAASALGDVDVSGWSDDTLRARLDELSTVLCRVDAQLSRLADEVRARGFAVTEPVVEPLPKRVRATLAAVA
ncbi:hypothetical protein [Rhizomonospora bruguierae]|uniref:hypothetical protein n=1 Tax=Rhizomonospora bruguierae TaxID=1581705 RepID=UPI001BCEC5CC|nr:hypothetical protein [Micromonospora sp. NBRC 107566]